MTYAPTYKDSTDTYLMYIDGAWTQSESDTTYPNYNPARKDEVLGYVPEATPEEVDAAMAAAERDFPAWRAVSGNIKTRLFLHLAQVLDRHHGDIVATMTREMGKTHFDSGLDLDEAIGVVECVAPQGLSLKGETYPKNAEGVVMESRLEPRGVAAIITPFNFPIAIPIAQVVAALVTGNTVVWKPSHLTPECGQIIASAICDSFKWAEERFGITLPTGAFNMVMGDAVTGEAMARHHVVKTLSFTGSKSVGDAIDAVASGLGKRVLKEVGGINFFYVHKDADIVRAARNFVYGKTITSGQRCTSIQQVLCDEEVYEAFVAAAIRESAGIVIGDGASDELAACDVKRGTYALAPLVSEEQRDRVLGLIREGVAQGACIRHQITMPEELAGKGWYAPFTLMENVSPENVLSRTEIFGPVGVLSRVSGVNDAIKQINDTVGIVACIESRDKDVTEHFIQNVLRTRVDDGRHGTGAFWATRFGGDRGAGSGNPALDENMVMAYVLWKTIYRAYNAVIEP
jgi:acyl-CoA reductase-like NAD-dependent aldehyde dehydrogenase